MKKKPKPSALIDKHGKSCPFLLGEMIDLCLFTNYGYEEEIFLWSEVEPDVIMIIKEAVTFSTNGQKIKELLKEYEAIIDNRFGILDL